MKNNSRKTNNASAGRGSKIKLALVIAAVAVIVIGAAWQVCSMHGVKLFGNGANETQSDKPAKKVKNTFEDYLLDGPYFAGAAEDAEYDSKSELCRVEEVSNSGIKISNAYYIFNEAGDIEQIRLRYGIADTSSKVNLIVRGKVSLHDFDGNEILGIYNALTDNYGGKYRSQIVNVNLAGGKYAASRGSTFVLDIKVDTTNLAAKYLITVPNEDGTFPELHHFESDGIDSPYVMGDNIGTEESFTALECAVSTESENGIKLSNVYYITDPQNGVEQLRMRYAAGEKDEELNLAFSGRVSVYAESGEEMIGIFNTQTETFDGYATQIVNVDFSESWYAGYAGKNIIIALAVDGTDYSARYTVSVPAQEQ